MYSSFTSSRCMSSSMGVGVGVYVGVDVNGDVADDKRRLFKDSLLVLASGAFLALHFSCWVWVGATMLVSPQYSIQAPHDTYFKPKDCDGTSSLLIPLHTSNLRNILHCFCRVFIIHP